MKTDILGVKIDNINLPNAVTMVEAWIWNPGKHYIVTPNLEIILAAQKDPEFKRILNNADLAIPDSSSLGFSNWLLKKSRWERIFLWPLILFPTKQLIYFERVAGTDLMEELCKVAAEKGFTVSFLGGKDRVAEETAERLKKKYPELKVGYAGSGGEVNKDGKVQDSVIPMKMGIHKDKSLYRSPIRSGMTDKESSIPPCDILFVAFGHIKQERWIANNLDKIPTHVAMGVGGAFDYLSGKVPRAPYWLRTLGFEWLFRLIVQPRRIKRQLGLIGYIWRIIIA